MQTRESVRQAVKFLLFSVSAGIIQFGTSTLLLEFSGWSYWPCYLIGLVLSVVYNFTLNRKFTFKSANNVPLAMLEVFGYYAVFTPVSTLWGDALTGVGWNEYLVLFLTMVVNFVTEFLFDRFVVFRNSINTNERAKRNCAAPDAETLAEAAAAEETEDSRRIEDSVEEGRK